jgi:hypothetical protein
MFPLRDVWKLTNPICFHMLTMEERALATHIGDRLIELYVERDEAVLAGELDRVHDLQTEIDEAAAQRQEIIRSAGDPA